MKGTGAKRNVCPGSYVSTGAKFPVALVESAPMRGTRPLQLWCRSRTLNAFGPLQLSQTALLNLRGEGKKSRVGNGWNMGGAITGDGERTEREKYK